MQASALLEALLAQRKSWVELEAGKRVQIRRPAQTELGAFIGLDRTLSVGVKQVQEYVCGWEGITEADVLGPELGASSAAPFAADLWAALVADRPAWAGAAAKGLLDAIVAHQLKESQAAKN